jgi:N-glycosidase YbiA
MNKKIISLVMTLVAFVGGSLHAAQSIGDRVTVVPISYNAGEWKILLGHNVQTGYWECFSDTRQNPSESNDSVAQRALYNQTGSVYDFVTQDYKFMVNYQGSVTIFIKVLFFRGKNLFEQARNKYVDNFKWVSASDLGQDGDVRFSQANVHRGVLKNLRINFARAVADINRQLLPAGGAGPAVVAPQVVPGPVVSHRSGGAAVAAGGGQSAVPNVAAQATHSGVTLGGKWSPDTLARQRQVGLYFYANGRPFYEFTNFWTCFPQIVIAGESWSTSEHYYQAQKFPVGSAAYKSVQSAATARDVFDLANGTNGTFKSHIRSDWNSISLKVMMTVVRAKFSQNSQLKALLLSTGQATLVENAGQNDPFFGAGADMNGVNHLGIILMRVRAELGGAPSFY